VEEIILPKELDQLMSIKGEFIRIGLKNYFEFILKGEGSWRNWKTP